MELVTGTSSFEMPKMLDPVFDSLPEDDKKRLFENYGFVAKHIPINTITYAGLHNNGDKLASDIHVSLPGSRLISVRYEGKEVQFLKNETKVEVAKLPPTSSIYFVIWGQQDPNGSKLISISGVHSEGTIAVRQLVELSDHWTWIRDNWITFRLAFMLIVVIAFLASLYFSRAGVTEKKEP